MELTRACVKGVFLLHTSSQRRGSGDQIVVFPEAQTSQAGQLQRSGRKIHLFSFMNLRALPEK